MHGWYWTRALSGVRGYCWFHTVGFKSSKCVNACTTHGKILVFLVPHLTASKHSASLKTSSGSCYFSKRILNCLSYICVLSDHRGFFVILVARISMWCCILVPLSTLSTWNWRILSHLMSHGLAYSRICCYQRPCLEVLWSRSPDWRCIAPRAPGREDRWERLVKSVKSAMKSSLDNRFLTRVGLEAILLGTEICVNSRPLNFVGDGVNSVAPSTRDHCLS